MFKVVAIFFFACIVVLSTYYGFSSGKRLHSLIDQYALLACEKQILRERIIGNCEIITSDASPLLNMYEYKIRYFDLNGKEGAMDLIVLGRDDVFYYEIEPNFQDTILRK